MALLKVLLTAKSTATHPFSGPGMLEFASLRPAVVATLDCGTSRKTGWTEFHLANGTEGRDVCPVVCCCSRVANVYP